MFLKRFSLCVNVLLYNYILYVHINSFEAEEEPLRHALMYNVSLRLFPKRAFPQYNNRPALWYSFAVSIPLPPPLPREENSFDVLDKRASIKSALVHIPPASVYTREKRENVTKQPNARVSIRAIRALVRYR